MRSENFREIAAALAAAQCEMQNAAANSKNPDFHSKYADLGSVRNACVPVLARNGIALTQIIERDGDNLLTLSTTLLHKSGEWISSEFPLPEKLLEENPQMFGSALSYARRYSLGSICGIATDHDDDGNMAVVGLNMIPGETPQEATLRMAPAAPVAPVVPPAPPSPPKPPAAPSEPFPSVRTPAAPFMSIRKETSLDGLVRLFQMWGFTGKDREPEGWLAHLLATSPGEYGELVMLYMARMKELLGPTTTTAKPKQKVAAE